MIFSLEVDIMFTDFYFEFFRDEKCGHFLSQKLDGKMIFTDY